MRPEIPTYWSSDSRMFSTKNDDYLLAGLLNQSIPSSDHRVTEWNFQATECRIYHRGNQAVRTLFIAFSSFWEAGHFITPPRALESPPPPNHYHFYWNNITLIVNPTIPMGKRVDWWKQWAQQHVSHSEGNVYWGHLGPCETPTITCQYQPPDGEIYDARRW